jgi:biopolymer transport protein TolR
MALNPVQKSKGGRVSLSEINVTPMVDVMLVLLIIFMVSAPLMQQGVDIKLPRADAGNLNPDENPVQLTLRANQNVEIDGKSVPFPEVGSRLAALVKSRPELQVLVQADESVPYGDVARLMARVKKANIKKVGLVTAPEEGSGGGPRSP